jgi:amino acid transporter
MGMGLFNNSGEILAFTVIGVAVIFAMKGTAEVIGRWPIAIGMIEFVRVFVDKDLAIVIGFAYWYLRPNLE